MRKIVLGNYDTEIHGPWTLSSLELTAAEHRAQFVEVPGRDGDLDLSTALTDGVPRYGSRTLTATLEQSDGTRMTREAAINKMINQLDGLRMNIRLPDDDAHYLTGRVSVAMDFNDLAHAKVIVTAVCDPWRYANFETVLRMTAEATPKDAILTNMGRRAVVPTLTISGTEARVNLVCGASSWALDPGTYQLPDIVIPQGGVEITYSGSGTLVWTYREAVL